MIDKDYKTILVTNTHIINNVYNDNATLDLFAAPENKEFQSQIKRESSIVCTLEI